jgi:hypothetical protein
MCTPYTSDKQFFKIKFYYFFMELERRKTNGYGYADWSQKSTKGHLTVPLPDGDGRKV